MDGRRTTSEVARRGTGPAAGGGKSAERYDDEYRAIQASLEEYLDQRLKQISAGVEAARPGGSRQWRFEVYFLATLILFTLIWLRVPPPAWLPTPWASPAKEAASPGDPAAEGREPAPPFDLSDPIAAWQRFVSEEAEVLLPRLRALAGEAGRAEETSGFAAWASALERGAPIPDTGALRAALFAAIYDRHFETVAEPEASAENEASPDVASEDSYPPEHLDALLRALDLRQHFGEALTVDPAFETAVVVGWLRSQAAVGDGGAAP